jgi:hypothetical protein
VLEGVVIARDGEAVEIQGPDGDRHRLTLGSNTRLIWSEVSSALGELAPGVRVRASYELLEGEAVAREVWVLGRR